MMTIQEINEMCDTNFNSVEEFKDNAPWGCISICRKLSPEFIREFQDRVDWHLISIYQKLSEGFIREFKDKVRWDSISIYQVLSEEFIREFKNRVNWHLISIYQKLSEGFIREFKDKVEWEQIPIFQVLSEEFIREFKNRVNWRLISICQKLSEEFIRDFKHKVSWYHILQYQKLSPSFIEEFQDKLDLYFIEDSWHYKSTEDKKQAVIDTGMYECHEDYFIAYKGIREDRYSAFNFQHQYLAGQTYESWCDCSDDEDSFGLSAWDYENAKEYCPELVVKVKVRYEDVGRVVHNGGKVRCFKIEILD